MARATTEQRLTVRPTRVSFTNEMDVRTRSLSSSERSPWHDDAGSTTRALRDCQASSVGLRAGAEVEAQYRAMLDEPALAAYRVPDGRTRAIQDADGLETIHGQESCLTHLGEVDDANLG